MAPPKYIYLVRHGQSEANVNHDLLKTVPDWKVGLTEYGRQQARLAGAYIRKCIVNDFPKGLENPEPAVYCSPYQRTRETMTQMIIPMTDGKYRSLRDPKWVFSFTPKYDPRLREQDWGNYKDSEVAKKIEDERDKFGTFFYRIPDGESGADVYDRLSVFMDTLWRDFEKKDFPRVAIIVTHGLTMRLFLMRWFHWDIYTYESIKNPRNAEVWRISRGEDGKWNMDTQMEFKHFTGASLAKL